MTNQQFEEAIQQAVNEIQTLPPNQRDSLLTLLEETKQRHRSTANATKRAMEAVDDLRLLQKYLLFDREARAREALMKHNTETDMDQDQRAA